MRPGFLWRVSLIAGLGGILYGFDMGIIAGALLFVRESFALSTRMEEMVVSIVLVGAMVGAVAGGSIADHIGSAPRCCGAAAFFWLARCWLSGRLLSQF